MNTKKKYYRIVFKTISPLSVGSGENEITDKDVMLDSLGQPYIPGTAMAGVYRSLLPEDKANEYFGKLLYKDNDINESQVIVYDACLYGKEDGNIVKRDMVALDEYKVAKKGAKLDFQTVEPGIRFVTFIEHNIHDNDSENVIDTILSSWDKNGLHFGSKTMRGYGLTQLEKDELKYAEFSEFDDKWLNFDMYDESSDPNSPWNPYVISENKNVQANRINICISMSLTGGISIREYSTEVDKADYKQMRLKSGNNKYPLIPGTSFAGAFRSQMKKLGMKEDDEKVLFGSTKNKSLISFSECYIDGGKDIIYTRNAIDRFTGGTVDGALYTEETHYHGDTDLNIGIIKSDEYKFEEITKLLAAAIMDLNNGYMAVGGLTAIGRGLFTVNSIKVNDKNVESISYDNIVKAITEEGHENKQ